MKPSDRDISTLRHIIRYCDEIAEMIHGHELTLDKVKADPLYRNALAMSILQIGELVNVLSDGFKTTNNHAVPWHEIKRMRDKAAHHYGSFDAEILWETAVNDITPLKTFCQQYIEALQG